jgi:hypothetical protein
MKLSGPEVSRILRHQGTCASSYRELYHVVVSLVAEVGTPAEVNNCPAANAQKGIKDGFALDTVEETPSEEGFATEQRLILSEESRPHQREKAPIEAGP